MPPSSRITISATIPIRSTVATLIPSSGKRSDAIAAAINRSAGAGTGTHWVSLNVASASKIATATTSTSVLNASRISKSASVSGASRPNRASGRLR